MDGLLKHFGLSCSPFDGATNPDEALLTPAQAEAWAMLRFIERNNKEGGALLGPPGVGKSYLLRGWVRQASASTAVFWLDGVSPRAAAGEGLYMAPGEGSARPAPEPRLLTELRPLAAERWLLVVDHADQLAGSAWAGLAQWVTRCDCTAVNSSLAFAGLQRLSNTSEHPACRRLQERLFRTCIIPAPDAETIREYIGGSLARASAGAARIFTAAAVNRIAADSGGDMRRLNALCENALIEAFAEERLVVDEGIAAKAAAMVGSPPARQSLTPQTFAAEAAAPSAPAAADDHATLAPIQPSATRAIKFVQPAASAKPTPAPQNAVPPAPLAQPRLKLEISASLLGASRIVRQRDEVERRLDELARNPGPPRRRERRGQAREELRGKTLIVGFEQERGDLRPCVAAPRSISGEGIGFVIDRYVHPGTRCSVWYLDDGARNELRGEVVRCRYVPDSPGLHDVGVRLREASARTPAVAGDLARARTA